jgi:DNA-binding NarL/FixJ family response regulator
VEGDEMLRITIMHEHDLVRAGLAVFVATKPDMLLVGEAQDCHELGHYANARPDVILTDVNIASPNGISILGQIKRDNPGARVIVLTDETDPERLAAARDAGVERVLSKTVAPDELADALRGSQQTTYDEPMLHEASLVAAIS